MPAPATHRKRLTSVWLWLAIAAVIGITVFAIVEGTQSTSDASTANTGYQQRPQDVTLKSCSDAGGALKGSVAVTNHTSKTATYAIAVVFDSPDGKTQYDEATAIVDALDPGQSSGPQTLPSSKRVGDIPVICKVVGAAYYAS